MVDAASSGYGEEGDDARAPTSPPSIFSGRDPGVCALSPRRRLDCWRAASSRASGDAARGSAEPLSVRPSTRAERVTRLSSPTSVTPQRGAACVAGRGPPLAAADRAADRVTASTRDERHGRRQRASACRIRQRSGSAAPRDRAADGERQAGQPVATLVRATTLDPAYVRSAERTASRSPQLRHRGSPDDVFMTYDADTTRRGAPTAGQRRGCPRCTPPRSAPTMPSLRSQRLPGLHPGRDPSGGVTGAEVVDPRWQRHRGSARLARSSSVRPPAWRATTNSTRAGRQQRPDAMLADVRTRPRTVDGVPGTPCPGPCRCRSRPAPRARVRTTAGCASGGRRARPTQASARRSDGGRHRPGSAAVSPRRSAPQDLTGQPGDVGARALGRSGRLHDVAQHDAHDHVDGRVEVLGVDPGGVRRHACA